MNETLAVLTGRMNKQLYEFDAIRADQKETHLQLLRMLPERDAALSRAAALRAARAHLRAERQTGMDQLTDIARQLIQLMQRIKSVHTMP